MDRDCTIQALKERVVSFCEAREWDQFHTPEQLSIGIVTEASELLALFRFKSEAQIRELLDSPSGRENVSDELADVLFFVLRFSQMTGIDLSKALADKLVKNESKYPEQLARGRNLKYDEL